MDDHPLPFRRVACFVCLQLGSRRTVSNADFDFKIFKLELIILFCLCDLPLDTVVY